MTSTLHILMLSLLVTALAAPAAAAASDGAVGAADARPLAALPFTGYDLLFASSGGAVAFIVGALVLLVSARRPKPRPEAAAGARASEADAPRAGVAAGSR